jgi:hypothetical protein
MKVHQDLTYEGEQPGESHPLWASSLFDELVELGFTGQLLSVADRSNPGQRAAAALRGVSGIAGPRRGDWGAALFGEVARRVGLRQGRGHLVDALDRVARRLGGVTGRWRFDRMATLARDGRPPHSPTSRSITAYGSTCARHGTVTASACRPTTA